jgi:Mg-chelatase subunit ChlD
MNMGTRKRIVAASVTGAMLLAAALGLLGANAIHRAEPAAAAAPTPGSSCSAAISRTIVPDHIRSCERSDVSLHVRPYCPGEPLNVVLVLLGYASNQYGTNGPAICQRWNAAAIESLQMSTHPNVKVGIVYFYGSGSVLLELTNDEKEVRKKSRVQYYDLYYDPALDMPSIFRKAAKMLQAAGDREHSVIIFIGAMWLGEDPRYPHYGEQYRSWFKAATIAKQAANPFMVGCMSWGCKLWSDWWKAASPGYFFDDAGFGAFKGAISKLVNKTTRADVDGLVVDEEWPAGVDLVPDSVAPAPALLDNPNRRLRWDMTGPITQALTLTYQVRPLELGTHYFTGGQAVVTDTLARAKMLPLPTGGLTVTGPCATPTYTPSPEPTPTYTATPGPTATWTAIATATPTPTATATCRPAPVYLPLALREQCVPSQKRIDVALVIDASTSMLEATAAGPTKLDTARAAVRTFLDQLHLDAGDQATIVAFNADATVLQTLTTNRGGLDQALDRIQTAQQTRIHRGIEEATKELTSARHRSGNVPAMIVLTDGRANPESPEVAVAQAALAKAAGITVLTIGIGNEVDFDALERMASKSGYFYRAPKAEDLEGIYRDIARVIPCPAEQFWGRRP